MSQPLIDVNQQGSVIEKREKLQEGPLGAAFAIPVFGVVNFVILIFLTFFNFVSGDDYKYVLLHLTSLIGFVFLIAAARSVQREIEPSISGRIVVSRFLTIAAIISLVVYVPLGAYALFKEFPGDNSIQLKFWGLAMFLLAVFSLGSSVALILAINGYRKAYNRSASSLCEKRGVRFSDHFGAEEEGTAYWGGEWTEESQE